MPFSCSRSYFAASAVLVEREGQLVIVIEREGQRIEEALGPGFEPGTVSFAGSLDAHEIEQVVETPP
ncbi:MAG: hypothetical protein HY744_26040 [Deltaproteobacteria bacterium]|nr:hypothetical protein [Deltaproteobacteria bacterium]